MTDPTQDRAARLRKEYEICQYRGHTPGGMSLTQGWTTWETCKWCGVTYHIKVTREVIEGPHEF